jgi:uncharacterized damage-inducible protein DinB
MKNLNQWDILLMTEPNNHWTGAGSGIALREIEFSRVDRRPVNFNVRGLTASQNSSEIMNNTQTLIAALEGAPDIIIGLVREVPSQNLKRRPSPNKWSAHEHACHISSADTAYLARLELMLSDPAPYIRAMEPSPEEEAGSLLQIDLDEALDQYVRERARLVKRLKELTVEEWQRTAEHEEYSHYSVLIMFRQLLLHEMLHGYRIEELMLKKDWD